MAIEIITKRNVKTPAWSITLLVVSLILIIFGVLCYFYLSSQSKKINEKLVVSQSESEINKDVLAKEKEINLINSKADIFSRIILNHKSAAKIFDFFEKFCLKNVWFNDFNINQQEAKVFGKADNFVSLEQQIIFLRKQSAVSSVILSGAEISKEGGVDFSFTVNFNSQVYK
jgi:hypothetical protein